MNILEKIFDKLNFNFLNRKNSPSIKAGGNISAGRDIIVGGNKQMPKAAVFSGGKDATFINCTMVGHDYGMINVGENTKVIDSDIHNVDENK